MGEKTSSILLIGGPDTGKTVYGTQLLGRLRAGTSGLTLRQTPDDISPFDGALKRLNQGVPPLHTSMNIYHEIVLPVEGAGMTMDLVWPDYSGELISDMLKDRRIKPGWQQRAINAEAWLLFVRLHMIQDYKDIITRPLNELVAARESQGESELSWSDQAALIELLQLLLYARGIDTVARIRSPILGVVLSCWDEIGDEEGPQPESILDDRLPLFSAFIRSRWTTEARYVFGLSSQGRALKGDAPDADYIEQGPAAFGYVVLPDGRSSSDLSLPLITLMQRV